jgi:hypothetical protein
MSFVLQKYLLLTSIYAMERDFYAPWLANTLLIHLNTFSIYGSPKCFLMLSPKRLLTLEELFEEALAAINLDADAIQEDGGRRG